MLNLLNTPGPSWLVLLVLLLLPHFMYHSTSSSFYCNSLFCWLSQFVLCHWSFLVESLAEMILLLVFLVALVDFDLRVDGTTDDF